jgi:hypothetical protein
MEENRVLLRGLLKIYAPSSTWSGLLWYGLFWLLRNLSCLWQATF